MKAMLIKKGQSLLSRHLLLAILLFFFVAGCLNVIGHFVGLGWNLTASESPGIYSYYPVRSRLLAVGDLVDFDLSNANYIPKGAKPFKKIAAVPGEWLLSVGRRLYACPRKSSSVKKACRFLGECLLHDSLGRSLHCQKWKGYPIPNDTYYLQSTRVKNSFDSRYFGLIGRRSIHHRLRFLKRFKSRPAAGKVF